MTEDTVFPLDDAPTSYPPCPIVEDCTDCPYEKQCFPDCWEDQLLDDWLSY